MAKGLNLLRRLDSPCCVPKLVGTCTGESIPRDNVFSFSESYLLESLAIFRYNATFTVFQEPKTETSMPEEVARCLAEEVPGRVSQRALSSFDMETHWKPTNPDDPRSYQTCQDGGGGVEGRGPGGEMIRKKHMNIYLEKRMHVHTYWQNFIKYPIKHQ